MRWAGPVQGCRAPAGGILNAPGPCPPLSAIPAPSHLQSHQSAPAEEDMRVGLQPMFSPSCLLVDIGCSAQDASQQSLLLLRTV